GVVANGLRARADGLARQRDFLAQQRSVLESERVSLLSSDALRVKPAVVSRALVPVGSVGSGLWSRLVLGLVLGLALGVGLAGVVGGWWFAGGVGVGGGGGGQAGRAHGRGRVVADHRTAAPRPDHLRTSATREFLQDRERAFSPSGL